MPKMLVARPEVRLRRLSHPYKRTSTHIEYDAKARLPFLTILAFGNDPDAMSRFLQALSTLPPYLYSDLVPARRDSTASSSARRRHNDRRERPTNDKKYNNQRQLNPPQHKPNVQKPIRSLMVTVILILFIMVYLTWRMLGLHG
ncbi:hypothetical protein L218DRAFT_1008950 [Marasmius fiardii PR-910]|nr:hypothetical protein L218DRAFT_1008950 [Marasmius fiardii PR-910]